jgi:hypothetical protein
MTYDPDQLWSVWVWNAFWHTLYFVILIAIAILWRPTENNSRYAYSEMPTEDDVPLTNVGSAETTASVATIGEDEEGKELGGQAKLE